MRQVIKYVFFSIFFIVFGFFVYSYFSQEKTKDTLTLYGNVDVREVDMSFRVAGVIKNLFFEEGDLVLKGAKVAELERTPYDAEVDKSMAELKAVLAELENAKLLLDRRRKLEKVGGVSQEELDDATAKYKQLQAQFLAAKANVKIIKDNLSYTEVFSPTDSILLTRIKEPGSTIKLGDPVCTLSILSPVWIRAYVAEPDLGNVIFGMKAEIETDTLKGKIYHGKVGFISPVAEFTPKTVQTTTLRTDLVYRLRIYVENPDALLKQGMPATVKLRLENR